MTSYGLPLTFKAIEIATGKRVSTNKLVLDPGDGQWFACYGGDTIRHDEEWVTEILLYQATGYRDKKKAPVYFADILYCVSSEKLFRVELVNCGLALRQVFIEEQRLVCFARSEQVFSFTDSRVKQLVAVGNVHTPTKEIESQIEQLQRELFS